MVDTRISGCTQRDKLTPLAPGLHLRDGAYTIQEKLGMGGLRDCLSGAVKINYLVMQIWWHSKNSCCPYFLIESTHESGRTVSGGSEIACPSTASTDSQVLRLVYRRPSSLPGHGKSARRKPESARSKNGRLAEREVAAAVLANVRHIEISPQQ